VSGTPLVLAHRGGARETPENTRLALEHAVASGADGIELDVRLAADGVPIVFHDEGLDRFPRRSSNRERGPEDVDAAEQGEEGASREGGASRIAEMPLADLLAIDLGARRRRFRGTRIPTLAEALALTSSLSLVNLELKPTGDPWRLVEAVASQLTRLATDDRYVLTSFDPRIVGALRIRLPRLSRGQILDSPPLDDAWRDEPAVSLSLALARTGLAEQAARGGQQVLVWTENDPRRLTLWGRRGVAAVITDRPAHFAAVRAGERVSETLGPPREHEVARSGVEPPETQQVKDLAHQETGDAAVHDVRVGDRRVAANSGQQAEKPVDT